MKKHVALILVVLMLTSLLAGCVDGATAKDPAAETMVTDNQPTEALAAETQEPTEEPAVETLSGEVTVWYPDTWSMNAPNFVENWKAAIGEQYPDVNVIFEEYVEAGILEKLTVAMATGTTPDVYFDVQSRISAAANSGLLTDMSDVVAEVGSNFTGDYAEVGKIGDETLYLPFTSLNCYSIAINMDIAREVGADAYLPKDGVHWSYEDFLKCCELAKAGNYYGTQLWGGGPTGDAAMYSLYMSAGSELFNDDFSACTINNPATKQSLELLQTLIENEYVPAGAATTVDYNEAFFAEQSLFSLPQGGAFIIMSRNKAFEAGELSSIFDMDFVMYPTPDGTREPVGACFGTSGFCIFKNDENADTLAAAKAIIKIVYEDPSYMSDMVTNNGAAPVLSTARAVVDDKYVPYVEKGDRFTATYMNESFGVLEGWWGDWRNAYFPVIQKFYAGNADVDSTLVELEQVGNDVLANYAANNS